MKSTLPPSTRAKDKAPAGPSKRKVFPKVYVEVPPLSKKQAKLQTGLKETKDSGDIVMSTSKPALTKVKPKARPAYQIPKTDSKDESQTVASDSDRSESTARLFRELTDTPPLLKDTRVRPALQEQGPPATPFPMAPPTHAAAPSRTPFSFSDYDFNECPPATSITPSNAAPLMLSGPAAQTTVPAGQMMPQAAVSGFQPITFDTMRAMWHMFQAQQNGMMGAFAMNPMANGGFGGDSGHSSQMTGQGFNWAPGASEAGHGTDANTLHEPPQFMQSTPAHAQNPDWSADHGPATGNRTHANQSQNAQAGPSRRR